MMWTGMRMVGVLWLAGIAGLPGAVRGQESMSLLDRPAQLSTSNETLGAALRSLQASSGATISFSADLVEPFTDVSCACADFTVRMALDSLLVDTGLEYVLARRQILVGLRRTEGENSPFIAGVVTDAESGRPLPAAEVFAAGGGGSVLSRDDGSFILREIGEGPVTLTVSSIGYDAWTGDIETARLGDHLRVQLVARPIPLPAMVIAPGSFGALEVSPAMGATTVSREDIEAIPTLGDDVFRTLKGMPGVSSDDVSARLSVRGSSDRNLLFLLDGMELYEPYHLRDLDGVFGIVDVQALGGINLISGGFAADYGDRSAGVFDMRTRRAPTQGTRTTLGVSLGVLSASSQGTFAQGKGQWLTSLRRGSLEYAMTVAGVADDLDPRYWDALGRVQYLSGKHLFWAETLLAGDGLDWRDDLVETAVSSKWSSRYAWLGWRAAFNARVELQTMISTGRLDRDRSGSVLAPGQGVFTPLVADISDTSDFDFVGVKQDLSLELSDDAVFRTGYDFRDAAGSYAYRAETARYELSPDNLVSIREDTTGVNVSPSGTRLGVFGALRTRLGRSFTVEAGARYDRQTHSGDSDIAPRLLARWDANHRTSIKASWGHYYQSQGIHELQTTDGEDSYSSSERAEQTAVGLERDLGSGVSLRVEAYSRMIDNPRPIFENLSRARDPILEVASDRVRLAISEGRSQGVEAVLNREHAGALAWSASYALSRAEYRIDDAWVSGMQEQRHTANLRLAYRPNRAWQISSSWLYHTGWPLTAQVLDVETTVDAGGEPSVEVIRRGFGPLNAERLPAYHRLDVRVTRTFEFKTSALEVYLDVFNAYNRENLRGYRWDLINTGANLTTRREADEEQLPFLPTIGLRWVF